jgi:hypothetical protein
MQPASRKRSSGELLVACWCWLNVLVMIPSLGRPVLVLGGFAERGSMATLIKALIFVLGVVLGLGVLARLRPARLILLGWLPLAWLNALAIDLNVTCSLPVKIAAYGEALYGGLVPWVWVQLFEPSDFVAMHVVNAVVTGAVLVFLLMRGAVYSVERRTRTVVTG